MKNHKNRKYKVNIDFIQNWSYDLAYILGFLMADGYVNYNGCFITLCDKDVEILEFIKNKICPQKLIKFKTEYNKKYNKNYYKCRLDIYSVELAKILSEKYNLIQAKTGKEKLPNIPNEYFGSYLRGVFDGDGHIECTKYHPLYASICSASRNFLKDLRHRCNNIGQIYSFKKVGMPIYIWQMTTVDTLIFKEIIYSNEGFALQRKKKVFDSFTYNDIKSKRWGYDEDQLIANNINKSIIEISKLCGRTCGATKNRICQLGLQKREVHQWKQDELDLIRNIALSKSNRDISLIFNCTSACISKIIRYYNLRPKLRNYWSQEENQFILNNHDKIPIQEMANKLGRTWHSTQCQKSRLINKER